jgi:hypothetical protein
MERCSRNAGLLKLYPVIRSASAERMFLINPDRTRLCSRRMDNTNFSVTLLFGGKVYAIVVRVLGRN